MPELRGLTWNHTRGFAPMAATAQVFADHHPDVTFEWHRQSLWDFGEGRTEELARSFDLIVMDHPMTPALAESGLFLPFDDADATTTVGESAGTYVWRGTRWALAIDAACQVSAGRADLLAAADEPVPTTWDEVVSLARRTGRVVMPMTPIDLFSSLLTLCAGAGAPAGSTPDGMFLDPATAAAATELLYRLHDVIPAHCARRNPIATLEAMACTDDAWYCPLTFGYSNYSRAGYADRGIAFGDIPSTDHGGTAKGAVLGGAGIAVSAVGHAPELAAEYARWVSSDVVQRGEYMRAGGQPAAVAAWNDAEANRLTAGFFTLTRAAIDAASIRPLSRGYPVFQTTAAAVLHDALLAKRNPVRVMQEIERIYEKACTH